MAIQRSIGRKLVLINLLVTAIFLSTSCNSATPESVTVSTNETVLSGKELFTKHCVSCHGDDGKLGISGASDLSRTEMSANEINTLLETGRNGMPIMKEILGSKENMESVSNYVIELKK